MQRPLKFYRELRSDSISDITLKGSLYTPHAHSIEISKNIAIVKPRITRKSKALPFCYDIFKTSTHYWELSYNAARTCGTSGSWARWSVS